MKIGLFGGTFSPPHNGHVRFARLFIEKAELDKLYIMPAGVQPLKETDPWGSAGIRLDMARLAFGSFADVSNYEICAPGKSYTYKTLAYLQRIHPHDALFLLVGEDMFLSFDTWKKPEMIFSAATVVCMRRGDAGEAVLKEAGADYKQRYGAHVIYLAEEPFPVSSTQIRSLCAAGEDISHLVPTEVAKYITENGLYKYE